MTERRIRLRDDEVAASVIDGEALIINLSNGVYYSLPGSGAYMWAFLERGHSTASTAAAVVDRYGVAMDRARSDVEGLVDRLIAEGIVTDDVTNEREARGLDLAFPAPGAYAPPALERYADMEDLLALDPPMPGISNLPWKSEGGARPGS